MFLHTNCDHRCHMPTDSQLLLGWGNQASLTCVPVGGASACRYSSIRIVAHLLQFPSVHNIGDDATILTPLYNHGRRDDMMIRRPLLRALTTMPPHRGTPARSSLLLLRTYEPFAGIFVNDPCTITLRIFPSYQSCSRSPSPVNSSHMYL